MVEMKRRLDKETRNNKTLALETTHFTADNSRESQTKLRKQGCLVCKCVSTTTCPTEINYDINFDIIPITDNVIDGQEINLYWNICQTFTEKGSDLTVTDNSSTR